MGATEIKLDKCSVNVAFIQSFANENEFAKAAMKILWLDADEKTRRARIKELWKICKAQYPKDGNSNGVKTKAVEPEDTGAGTAVE